MTMPTDIRAIDLMIGFPKVDASKTYDYLRQTTHAEDASRPRSSPRATCSRTCPTSSTRATTVSTVTVARDGPVGRRDRHGRCRPNATSARAQGAPGSVHHQHSRSTPTTSPARCARSGESKDEYDIKAVTTFPAGCNPQVPVDDRRYYPIYQTCIDLDIPIVSNAGIAGPRFPSACQDVDAASTRSVTTSPSCAS